MPRRVKCERDILCLDALPSYVLRLIDLKELVPAHIQFGSQVKSQLVRVCAVLYSLFLSPFSFHVVWMLRAQQRRVLACH